MVDARGASFGVIEQPSHVSELALEELVVRTVCGEEDAVVVASGVLHGVDLRPLLETVRVLGAGPGEQVAARVERGSPALL